MTEYQQGLSDAQTGLMYDCSGHTQYYCNGYSQGFNTYLQQQTQTQTVEINVKGNGNYVGVNEEQTSSRGVESSSYPAPEHYDNMNGNVSKESPEIHCNNYWFIPWSCVLGYPMDADASIYPGTG